MSPSTSRQRSFRDSALYSLLSASVSPQFGDLLPSFQLSATSFLLPTFSFRVPAIWGSASFLSAISYQLLASCFQLPCPRNSCPGSPVPGLHPVSPQGRRGFRVGISFLLYIPPEEDLTPHIFTLHWRGSFPFRSSQTISSLPSPPPACPSTSCPVHFQGGVLCLLCPPFIPQVQFRNTPNPAGLIIPLLFPQVNIVPGGYPPP